jgi:hypothetical protein
MYSIRIKNVNFKNSKNNSQTIEIFITTNVIQISKLFTNEIVYMKWIEKIRLEKNKQINVVLKFIFFETINAIIRRSFVWDNETHVCEQLIRNCKIKQCFNCWVYDHIEIQCFLIIKFRKRAKSKHVESNCSTLSIKAKCEICENSHHAQSDLCSHRKRKKKE